jgi:hemerythrin-like metal-binding protein
MDSIEYLAWEDKYVLKVGKIDSAHKQIFTFLNDAIRHCTGNSAEEANYFNIQIKAIIKYIAEHFAIEEELMVQNGHPKYKGHKAEHDRIYINSIKKINEIEMGKAVLNLSEFVQNLREDILKDIIEYDTGGERYFG